MQMQRVSRAGEVLQRAWQSPLSLYHQEASRAQQQSVQRGVIIASQRPPGPAPPFLQTEMKTSSPVKSPCS